jgi:membrane protein YdbS with pleckstrin-like domain
MSETPDPGKNAEWRRNPKLTKIWISMRISWFLICVVVATTVGALYGYETYGWFGAVGTSLLGLILGTIVGAAPQILLM